MTAQKFELPLVRKEEIITGVHAYHFRRPQELTFKPGQYLKIKLPHKNPDEKGINRDFTIACSPTHTSEIMIMTKDGPSSFKQALLHLEVGTEVEIRAPFGSLVLPEETDKQQVFLTGGIGITPFISMVEYWADKKLDFPITLIASYSAAEEIIYKEMFDKISKDRSAFRYIPTVTHPDESPNWGGQTGRINKEILEKYIPNLNDSIYYITGPETLTHALFELLGEMKISEDNIRMEDFYGY